MLSGERAACSRRRELGYWSEKWSPSAVLRKTAIWPRVSGLSGQ